MAKGGSFWVRWRLSLAVGAAFLTVFLIPLKCEGNSELNEHIFDFGHVPAFAAAALFVFWKLPAAWPRGRRLATAFAASAFLAAAIEALQGVTGRDASWVDVLHGVAGAFVAVFALLLWPHGFRARLLATLYTAMICAAVALPATRVAGMMVWRRENFPLISDFESPAEFRLWHDVIPNDNPYGATLSRSTIGVSHGHGSARIYVWMKKDYPGIRLYTDDQDWSAYRTFAFDIYNPGPPFELSMRVDDDLPAPRHNDRFTCALPMAHGWTHARVPLDDIRRGAKGHALRLNAIRRVIFFLDQPTEPRVFYIDWIRLE